MAGLGTVINVGAIVAGGVLGLFSGRLLKDETQESVMKTLGIATVFLGIGGCMSKMMTADKSGILSAGGTMMMILSLVLGTLAGEALRLEHQMERFGSWLKEKTGNSGEHRFTDAFVTASLTVCVGAMAIVGSVEDGISGNYSILAAKAVLDFAIILIMTASMGKGCIFSAIPVGILQGSITALARLIQPVLTQSALNNLSYVGNILIACVGINLIWPKTFKVGNMLPAVLLAMILSYLPFSL